MATPIEIITDDHSIACVAGGIVLVRDYSFGGGAVQLTTNWTVIIVMLSTCCPVRFVMCSTLLGQQQQNLGLGLTIIRPVLERIPGF